MKRTSRLTAGLLALLLLSGAGNAAAQATARVQAILFYSPTCPHCHQVMNNDLPPLLERFGDQLQIVPISVTDPAGIRAYRAMVQHLNLPDSRQGVPALLVGDTLLVGSDEVPRRLPAIVQRGLAAGGIAWPAVPEIREYLTTRGVITPSPSALASPYSPAPGQAPAPAQLSAPAGPARPRASHPQLP